MTTSLPPVSGPVTAFDIGYSGHPEAVRALALMLPGFFERQHLLGGCLHAFGEGHPDNIRAFFDGYVQSKFSKPNGQLDYGGDDLLTTPIRNMIERSVSPAGLMQLLLGRVAPEWRQRVLDSLLRSACVEPDGSVKQVQVLIDAGADVRANFGEAIGTVWLARDVGTLRLLYRAGADFSGRPEEARRFSQELLPYSPLSPTAKKSLPPFKR